MTRRCRQSAGERGTITLWILGLCLLLFALGGISVDLWRAFSVRRALAASADAAALAGASAVDEDAYRASAALVLVPELAESRARGSLSHQLDVAAMRGADVDADQESVTVAVRGEATLSLLRLVGAGTLDVEVRAAAVPRRSG